MLTASQAKTFDTLAITNSAPEMPRSGYDSESEDRPRRVLNVDGDFRLLNADQEMIFELHEFKPMAEDVDGHMVPFEGVLSLRPVPSTTAVLRAKTAVGNGTKGVWVGTVFTPETRCISDRHVCPRGRSTHQTLADL